MAARGVTTTILIAFATGYDPVSSGYVASLARPGGNLTGVTSLNVEIGPKRVELLRELVPTATSIALLVNPAAGPLRETVSTELQAAARKLGLQFHVFHASTVREFDAVFATLAQLRTGGLVIGSDPFFNSQSEQLAALAIRHSLPAIYQYREFAVAGGLMSYGGSLTEMYRQVGVYTGRILKGERPADLPVVQATKVELIVNLLGCQVPPDRFFYPIGSKEPIPWAFFLGPNFLYSSFLADPSQVPFRTGTRIGYVHHGSPATPCQMPVRAIIGAVVVAIQP